MRKRILASLFLLLCVTCVACTGQQGVDLSAYQDVDRNIVLHFGMTRTEVEQKIGVGVFFDWDAVLNEKNPERNRETINENRAKDGLEDYTYGLNENYIFITYQDGVVVALTACPPEPEDLLERSVWHNAFDLSYGAGHQDIVAACGEPSDFLEKMQVGPYSCERLVYYYDAEGKRLETDEGAQLSMEYYVEREHNSLLSYNVTDMREAPKL